MGGVVSSLFFHTSASGVLLWCITTVHASGVAHCFLRQQHGLSEFLTVSLLPLTLDIGWETTQNHWCCFPKPVGIQQ